MMINILSYLGMSLQSELCLWTLLGILRTIFDATLFKVNANLKQVWQMTMPPELPTHVQRGLRTIISGIVLVQCFTVYAYLAVYIVLLYPVFLEERPTLVLPWLLVAAVRKLLCELMSLAMGLGVCVLLGPGRPPCIKFLVTKLITIMPSFYMWMLVFTYYHALKISASYKTFTKSSPTSDYDLGLLELAVRRRRTKSLFDETHLRQNLFASFYNESSSIEKNLIVPRILNAQPSRAAPSTDISHKSSIENNIEANMFYGLPTPVSKTALTDSTADFWFTSENKIVPRDTDRILEQITQMMLRVGAYLKHDQFSHSICTLLSPPSKTILPQRKVSFPTDVAEPPPHVGSIKEGVASYIRDYPQIFRKKASESRILVPLQSFHIYSGPINKVETTNNSDDDEFDRISKTISETSEKSVAIQPNKVIRSLTDEDDGTNEDDTNHLRTLKQSSTTLTIINSQIETKIHENNEEEQAASTKTVLSTESSLMIQNIKQALNSLTNEGKTNNEETTTSMDVIDNNINETLQNNNQPKLSENPDQDK